VINGQSGVKDDVNLYHGEFYSRVFAFLEYADAVIIDMGGLGTLQEKAWAEGCIQCGVHNAVPIFVLSRTFWKHLTKHTHEVLTKHNFISDSDRELIRLVEIGKEAEIYTRIKAYYDARPQLVAKLARLLGDAA
jgi:predicted Rossmann-fold nucleotide-binding protein